MKNAQILKDMGRNTWGMLRNTGTRARAIGNLWVKASIVAEAAVVGKNIGVAPEVSTVIANVADKLPNVLEISTELPGVGDAIDYILTHYPAVQDIASDAHNMANIGVYWGAFSLLYILWRGLGWKKWRFEAGTSAVVWAALSVWILKEMSDTLQGYGNDIMSWLPLRFFESLPESMRETMLDADGRRKIYSTVLWATGAWTWYMAIKNIIRVISWPWKN